MREARVESPSVQNGFLPNREAYLPIQHRVEPRTTSAPLWFTRRAIDFVDGGYEFLSSSGVRYQQAIVHLGCHRLEMEGGDILGEIDSVCV